MNLLGLLVTHDPPDSVTKLIYQMLEVCDNVIIVDSSRDSFGIPDDLQSNPNLHFIHETKHLGLGHALNTAIGIGNNFSPDYGIIMEDDALFTDLSLLKKTIKAFCKGHSDKDLLYLAESSLKSENEFIESKKPLGSNSGLFLDFNLLNSIRFREEFFIDQIDIDFQYRIKRLGGKIFITKEILTTRAPVGRYSLYGDIVTRSNVLHTIAPWRFYLLVRNTLILYIEGINNTKTLMYIIGYFFKGLITKQNPFLLFNLFLHAIIDAINNNLGITYTLMKCRPDLV